MVLQRQKSHALCSGRTDARLLLKSLNWLPIQNRIAYKLAVLSYKTYIRAVFILHSSTFYVSVELGFIFSSCTSCTSAMHDI